MNTSECSQMNAKPSHARRRVAVTGTFDVRNYGDLLFPHVAQRRLAEHGIDLVAASPTGQPPGWGDCLPSVSVASLMQDRRIGGILIGGGNIIHCGPAHLPDYGGGQDRMAYPSLWLGAALIGSVLNCPVIWNAPGVPRPLNAREQSLARHALGSAEYVSVRDAASAAFLGDDSKAEIVPDTACDLPRLWPKADLRPIFHQALEQRGGQNAGRWITVHIKARSFHGPLSELAAKIDAFARAHDATPILLALAPCHEDDVAVRAVSAAMKTRHVDLSDASGLRDIAAAIAHADVHVGPSLHGYVTAAAYDVASALVTVPELPKFDGFLTHVNRPQDAVPDWDAGLALAARHLAERVGEIVPQSVDAALDRHWGAVASALGARRLDDLQRTRFARVVLQRHVIAEGFDPFLTGVLGAS